MDAVVPCVAECLDHLRLSRDVLLLAVLHVRRFRAGLPVGVEFDAVGRIEVDHLHLAAQPLVFGERCHHLQRVTEDHAVLPPFLVFVEAWAGVRIEVFRKCCKGQLCVCRIAANRRLSLHLLDQQSRENLFLLVDERRRRFQRGGTAGLFAAPDVLRVEIGVTRGEFLGEVGRVCTLQRIGDVRSRTPQQLFRGDAAVFARRQSRTRELPVHLVVFNRRRSLFSLFRLFRHDDLNLLN